MPPGAEAGPAATIPARGDAVRRRMRLLLAKAFTDVRRRVQTAPRRALLVFVVAIGALCGLTAVAFHGALALGRRLLVGPALDAASPWLRTLLVVALPAAVAALLGVLVPRLAPRAGGGLALVKQAYAAGTAPLDPRTLAGTFVATPLSLGSGAPLGPEGPTVLLTSGVAVLSARALGLPARVLRGMVPLGVAAGIAAIFNAPITGVVFALEEVVGTASRGVLGGSLVAAVAAAVVQRQLQGGLRLLPATPADWRDPRELLGFAVLGLVAGLMAGALPKIVQVLRERLERLTRAAGRHDLAARGALAGAAVGLLGLASPETLGIGYEPISGWLGGGGTAHQAGVAFLAKTLGVALALSAPLVGGIFAPSLFLGASLGAATAHAALLLLPAARIDPGAYALVGMGAFFAGFLRTPLAAVLIVFELTGDYALVLPLMLAVAIASVVSRRLTPSPADATPLLDGGGGRPEEGDPLARLRVADVMARPAAVVAAGTTLLDAARQLAATPHPLYPVVDEEGRCTGLLAAAEIDAAAREGRLQETVSQSSSPVPVAVLSGDTVSRAALALARAGTTRCPVLDEAGGRVVGFLAASDVLSARLRSARETRRGPEDPLA